MVIVVLLMMILDEDTGHGGNDETWYEAGTDRSESDLLICG